MSLFFTQVLYRDLGCASYVVGDAGEAIVVDPRWDIEVYLEIARAERLRITHVLDTHEHADHVSGSARLVARTGATGHRPGGPSGDAGTIGPGSELVVGNVRVRALATPGHRPEHLSFAISDLRRGESPWLVLTGDSLLVGDIARPDLAVEARAGARSLHDSLHELMALGDHVEVWPAHVGGSLCGGAGLSPKTSSTIGFERRHNPLLGLDRDPFVQGLVRALPSRPPNVERIVAINRGQGQELPSDPPRLDDTGLLELLREGVTVLDARHPDQFDIGHLAGAINLPIGSAGVGTRAGWALDSAQPLAIVAGDDAAAEAMISALQAVGFWSIAGWATADAPAWRAGGLPVAEADSWDLSRLATRLHTGDVQLIDVREPGEWASGHIAGSHHFPLNRMRELGALRLADDGRPTAVACAGGVRAAFAASLLRRTGRPGVVRVAGGGVPDLGRHGIPLAVGPD